MQFSRLLSSLSYFTFTSFPLPLQVNLIRLIPLRIIMGAAFASCYITIGGFSHPWLQAMGTQFLSYCISMGIDLHYRSAYRRLRTEEAALAAATADRNMAAKVKGLLPQVGGHWLCASHTCCALLLQARVHTCCRPLLGILPVLAAPLLASC